MGKEYPQDPQKLSHHSYDSIVFVQTIIVSALSRRFNFREKCDHPLTYRAGGFWGGGTGQADHLLYGQPQFEAVQRVTDPYLPLDLLVRQRRHYCTTFDVGSASGHIPCWHTHPQLCTEIRKVFINGFKQLKYSLYFI